jgi:drug/metabolite transporter (DMT)-like permease
MADIAARQAAPSLSLPVAMAAIGALLVWSGTGVANKVALQEIDPLTAGLLRSMLAGFIALAIVLVLRFPFPKSASDRLLFLVSGVTSFAFWPGVLSLGLGWTTATHAVLIMALLPVFTALIAKATERKVPRPGWWVGAAIALTGTTILVAIRDPGTGPASEASLLGDLTVLAGSITCSIGYVAGGKLTPRYGMWGGTFWSLAMALIVLIPAVAFLIPFTDWGAVGFAGWGGIAYMTFGSSIAGYCLWYWALGAGGIARIGTWQFGMPVIGVILAVVLLGEPVGWLLPLAGTIIMAGTIIAQKFA